MVSHRQRERFGQLLWAWLTSPARPYRSCAQSVIATTEETLELIEREQFQDLGCGAVDMSLLASVLLTPDTLLWTVDKNLDALATRLGVAFRGTFG